MIGEMAITAARTTAASSVRATPQLLPRRQGAFGDETSLRRDGVGLDHSSARLIAAKPELALERSALSKQVMKRLLSASIESSPPMLNRLLPKWPCSSLNSATKRNSMVTGLLLGFEKQFDVEVTPAPVQQMLIGAAN